MNRHDKMLIGSKGIHASRGSQELAIERRNEPLQIISDLSNVGVAYLAINVTGRAVLAAAMHCRFDAVRRVSSRGKAVEAMAAIHIPDINGKLIRLELVRPGSGLKPAHHVAANVKRTLQIRENLRRPRPGAITNRSAS
jgi:hypothetical protein